MSDRDLRSARAGAPTRTDRLDEIVRVDHAGEFGAVRIYEGQLAVFGRLRHKQAFAQKLRHMAEDEQVHLDRFNEIINERGVRPTAMAPVWHMAGFALGAVTALMGEKAAMACTAAVEDVIDKHYKGQIDELEHNRDEQELRGTIEKFREEEIEHKDAAIAEGAEETPGYELLSGAIKGACRLAIRISEKI